MFTRVSSLIFLFAKVIILFQLCKFFERNFHLEMKFFNQLAYMASDNS